MLGWVGFLRENVNWVLVVGGGRGGRVLPFVPEVVADQNERGGGGERERELAIGRQEKRSAVRTPEHIEKTET